MEQSILESLNKLYPVDLTKVESVTEEMFHCTAKEKVYFARITNYKSLVEQLEEVNYTNFLFEKGLGVSKTVTSLHGKPVEKMLLDKNEVLIVLYHAAPGIHLPRNQWNAEILKELGRQTGRLHRFSKEFEENYPVRYINNWHDNEEYNFLKYIPEEETVIREIANEVLTAIKAIPKSHSNYGLLHGDLWLENILVDKSTNITMVDFQDCEKHFYIFDLAVPVYSALEYSFTGGGNITEYGREIANAIIEGYQEENELSQEMLDMFPLFIKLKEIFEYSLMHMYLNIEKLTEEQIRIMNLHRIRLEQKYSIIEFS